MSQTERIYHIRQRLQSGNSISREQFLAELGISASTFKRDLAYMRDRINMPVEFDKNTGGYHLQHGGAAQQELPGIWFSADEIYALLTMQQLLSELQPGLLSPHIQPIVERLHHLIDGPQLASDEIKKRIRLVRVNARKIKLTAFEPISSAVLRRRQIRIQYFNRSRAQTDDRTLSPQRLVYYRDNWYLEAWCHLRHDMRSFSVDAISQVEILEQTARETPEAELAAKFSVGYGIFSGADLTWATLQFSSEKARWISKETWHPQQQSHFDDSGNYILKIPYSDDRELVMDILRHVPEVTVLEPVGLRERVIEQLESGLTAMRNCCEK